MAKIETEHGYFELEVMDDGTFGITTHDDGLWNTASIIGVTKNELIAIRDLITKELNRGITDDVKFTNDYINIFEVLNNRRQSLYKVEYKDEDWWELNRDQPI